jgi:hypothetical protein
LEYRRRTPAWWRENLEADRQFEDMLYECLDYTEAVVGAGVETRFAWGYVLTCVREDTSEVWRLTRGDLDVIKAYIAKHRPENGSQELRAVVWAMEIKVQNLERSLKSLTSEFQIHLTTYNLDKQPLKHKFEEIDANMETKVGALTLNLSRVEKGVAHEKSNLEKTDNEMKALVARVKKLEKPFWKKWGDGQAAEIGAQLGDLERLVGVGGERESF